MDFIKKNLIPLISGAVSLIAIALIVLGIMKLSSTYETMRSAEDQFNKISSIERGETVSTPDNKTLQLIPTESKVAELKKVFLDYKEQSYQTIQKILQDNIGYTPGNKEFKRKPLMEGVLPKPRSVDLPYTFRKKYQEVLKELLTRVKAGTVPSTKEINDEQEQVLQEFGFTPEAGAKTSEAKTAAPGRRRSDVGQDQSMDTQKKAAAIAAAKRAKDITMYCDLSIMDIIANAYNTSLGQPPSPEEMWWAQLSYWMQDDIFSAIAEVNSKSTNVLDAVVKRIVSMSLMHGYLVDNQGNLDFVGREQLQLPDSFSSLGSKQFYDVTHYSLSVIIDARQIPKFIDAMYRQQHNLLYTYKIEMLTPNTSDQAEAFYRYGTGPVVKLTTWWETYFIRDYYHWGIVSYGINKETGKPFVMLYDGTKKEQDDMEKRTGLRGLMPKAIRVALGSDTADSPDPDAPTAAPAPTGAVPPTN